VIFVANRTGVLEYDGRTWRTHRIPNQFVRSLAVAPDGVVYVGGVGEVGYLAADSTGSLAYTSLLPRLPEHARVFADVWTTYIVGGAAYFQTFRHIYRWDGREMRVWETPTRYHKAFAAHGRYLVREEGVGLVEITGDEVHVLPRGEMFAGLPIDAVVPVGEQSILIAARGGELHVYDGYGFSPFSTDADAYIRRQRIYHGAPLSDSTFAFTTTSGTVLLLNSRGRLLRVLGQDVGLEPTEMVLHVQQDAQGGLWLSLDTGIMRVDVPPSVTTFSGRNGIAGMVYSVARDGWTFYVTTSQGLFTLVPASSYREPARFRAVGGLNQQVWFVSQAGGRLLAASQNGVFEIHRGSARRVLDELAFSLTESVASPGIVYVGLKSGVGILRMGEDGWVATGSVVGLNVGEVRYVAENTDGSLWVGTLAEGLLRVRVRGEQAVSVEAFGAEHGLDGGAVALLASANGPVVISASGVYRLEGEGANVRFRLDAALTEAIVGDGSDPFLLNPRPDGAFWVSSGGRLRLLVPTAGGGYEDRTPAPLRFQGVGDQVVYAEDDGVVWLTNEQGLVRYDPSLAKDYSTPYRALVRAVRGRDGEVIFGGSESGYVPQSLPFGAGNLRFEFAAPSFNRPEETRYQVWLEGFDEGWSEWADLAYKEYTNLSEGQYRFHVRALNAQGVVSQTGSFGFRVLPPWYRTWWAYALYVLVAALVLWAYGRWRIRKHQELLRRERIARQQMEVANAHLRQANERLHQADKLKDDLLANTSHELRTPLTSILGFAAVLQEDLEGELREFASHIHRSGQRLLATVNALLDMARLQADVMEIEAEEMDLVREVHAIVGAMQPQADGKGLFLKVLPEGLAVSACLDRSALERVLTNLVGNAIKFTEQGGVTVLVDADPDHVYLTVRDTGIGIREEFLPHLFSAFSQASTGYARTYEGNGLGLAITQRIVHLLDGDIRVESPETGGTAFHVRLPRRDLRRDTPAVAAARPASRLDGSRVLLVEDPRRTHRHLQRSLRQHAHLDVAHGLEGALLRARTETYDLLLVDGHLGNGEVEAALAALRSARGTADAPAVAVTAFTMPGDHERYLRAGFADHLGKPFTRNRLLLSLEALLDRQPVPRT